MPISPFRPLAGVALSQRKIAQYRHAISAGQVIPLAHTPALRLAEQHLLLRSLQQPERTAPLSELLVDIPRLRIVNATTSTPGRSIVLRQICLRWAHGELSELRALPLLISFLDTQLAPEQTIAEAVARAGFSSTLLHLRRGLAAGLWCLLLEGWDSLPPAVQKPWHSWLHEILYRYPALPMVIVTGPAEAAQWPELDPWELSEAGPVAPQLPPAG